jgi:hypothetical protein
MLAVELEAQAKVIGRPLTNRESLVRRIYDWEAGGHRPRDYYVLFILVYASDEELAARTIVPGSELDRLMGALKMMGVPVNRRKFLLNSAALAAGVAGVPAVATDLEGQQRLAWMLKHPRSVDLPTVAYLGQQAISLLKQNEAHTVDLAAAGGHTAARAGHAAAGARPGRGRSARAGRGRGPISHPHGPAGLGRVRPA